LIAQGGVRIDDAVVDAEEVEAPTGVLRVGKRKFYRLT
jgi:hypothetical protein